MLLGWTSIRQTVGHLGDRGLLYLLCLVIIGLPQAMGGSLPWAVPAVVLLNGAAALLLLLDVAMRGRRIHGHWVFGGALAIIALLSLQLIPAGQLIQSVSEPTASLWQRAADAQLTTRAPRISLAPVRTQAALMVLLMLTASGFLFYNSFRSRERVFLLGICVVLAAVVGAILGFAPFVLDIPPLYADFGIMGNPLSGTFRNRNHFGFLMTLGLIMAGGLFLFVFNLQGKSMKGEKHHDLEPRLRRQRSALLVSLSVSGVLLALGLLFSLSRGAALSALLGLAMLAALAPARHRGKGLRRELLVSLAILAGAVVMGGMQAMSMVWDRYDKLVELGMLGANDRWYVWLESLELVKMFPVSGIGLGAFRVVSPLVEQGFVPGKVSLHAHNDWLEFVCEAGIPLALLALSCLVALSYTLWRRYRACDDLLCRQLGLAGICALLAVACHEWVDYSIRATGNAMQVIALLSLCLLISEISQQRAGKETIQHRWGSRQRWRQIALAAMLLIPLAAWGAMMPARIGAGLKLARLQAIVETDSGETNTGAARLTQARFCVGRADDILAAWPNCETALYYRGLYQQIAAACLVNAIVGDDSPETLPQRQEAVQAILKARDYTGQLCDNLPTNGYYQALHAQLLNQSAWYDETVAIDAIARAFQVAHANYPRVPQVIDLCLRAYTEILTVDRDELSEQRLDELSAEVEGMVRILLELEPGRALEVYAAAGVVSEDPDWLLDLTPPRLQCYQGLYEHLFSRGEFSACERVLDKMESFNAQRPALDDDDKLTAYELARTPRASRQQVAADIAQMRLLLAGIDGDSDNYEGLRREADQRRHEACRERLLAAETAAERGDTHAALRTGRRLLAEFPDQADLLARHGRWLTLAGDYEAAIDCLMPLLWLDDLSAEEAAMAAETAHLLTSYRQQDRHAKLLAGALLVRSCLAPAKSAELIQARETLQALLPDATGANEGRYAHLAAYYAGRASEGLGDTQGAIAYYELALRFCPMHRPSLQQLINMEADTDDILPHPGQPFGAAITALEGAGFAPGDLRSSRLGLPDGLTLWAMHSSPEIIAPGDAVSLCLLLEVSRDQVSQPAAGVDFVAGRETIFRHQWPATDFPFLWATARVGQLFVLKAEFTPQQRALNGQRVLTNGPVFAQFKGGGPDRSGAYLQVAFTVREAAP